MKIIITEDQHKILWLRRRLDDPEINELLTDIVIEGFDYTDPCNYDTYSSYEINIVNDSALTFINSYTELYSEDPFESNPLLWFVVKVILSKHRNRIQREYRDRYCDEEEDELNENFNPYSLIPPDLKRRITPGDLKKMGEQLLELAHYTKEVTKDTYETKLMSLIHYIIRELAMDKNSYNVSLETKETYNKLYNYLRYVYEDEIKEIWNNSLK